MIKRYKAEADTSITNAFKLTNIRATKSNTGGADSLQVFYLRDDLRNTDEESRILVRFPVTNMMQDRSDGRLAPSGSVDFFLRLYNVAHNQTTPDSVTYEIKAVSGSWDEGFGKDLDNYTSPGYGTLSGGYGATWLTGSSGSAWISEGGDFHASPSYEVYSENGFDDIELNITDLVEQWLDGSKENDGVCLKVSDADVAAQVSKYKQKFSARSSEYFLSQPIIEARWDSSYKENRDNFTPSSSLLSAEDNLNNLEYRNIVKGAYKDLAVSPPLYVRIFSEATGGDEITTTPLSPATASKADTGVYRTSLAADTDLDVVYDRWYTSSVADTPFFVGEISIETSTQDAQDYDVVMTNLKPVYGATETARFDVFTRKRNWTPNIYSVQQQAAEMHVVDDLFYKIERVQDGLEVVGYMTGSNATRLSYDGNSMYFEFDMALLEPQYSYEFIFATKKNNKLKEYKKNFKFRVE